ncbi:hypothetical protein ACFOPN_22650 [Xanthomonas hyacinthi]|uniref:hypothetical protein n=1 Tax=Xanthomonas hyacinthi TaxID=56455 RepID=UPI003621478B
MNRSVRRARTCAPPPPPRRLEPHIQQRLEQALPTPALRQAAVGGARAMFAHFHTHFALEAVA